MDDLPSPADAEIITVRPQHDTATLQKLPYFVGISGATAGSQGISMNLVIIPPGTSAEPGPFHSQESLKMLEFQASSNGSGDYASTPRPHPCCYRLTV